MSSRRSSLTMKTSSTMTATSMATKPAITGPMTAPMLGPPTASNPRPAAMGMTTRVAATPHHSGSR